MSACFQIFISKTRNDKMARIYPLFSGSKGNCYYVTAGGKGILIDAGRTAKQIEQALKDNSIDVKTIEGIFITHEHSDHIKGVRVLASRYGINVYATEGTLHQMDTQNHLVPEKFSSYVINSGASVAGMTIKPFQISHDCAEGVGYTIETADNRKLALATDTGYITPSMKKALMGSDVVIIESNHDVNMLLNGGYPYILKRRILSKNGHLSNDTCAEFLPELVRGGSTRLLLAHLSQENNMPQIALESARCSLTQRGIKEGIDYTIGVAKEVTDGSCIIF